MQISLEFLICQAINKAHHPSIRPSGVLGHLLQQMHNLYTFAQTLNSSGK
jgi:hypothetical protein